MNCTAPLAMALSSLSCGSSCGQAHGTVAGSGDETAPEPRVASMLDVCRLAVWRLPSESVWPRRPFSRRPGSWACGDLPPPIPVWRDGACRFLPRVGSPPTQGEGPPQSLHFKSISSFKIRVQSPVELLRVRPQWESLWGAQKPWSQKACDPRQRGKGQGRRFGSPFCELETVA